MNERIKKLINEIRTLNGVVGVHPWYNPEEEDGGMELEDGRWLVPLNVYLRKENKPGDLGVHVNDDIGVGDKFGG